jgi:Domain of unknown function (DUF309)
VRGAQSGGVGVVRVTEDRHVEVRVGDLLRIDARDVDDHEVRRIRVLDRDEVVVGQERLELPPEEEIDPTQQDRRHGANVERMADPYKSGLAHLRAGRYFEAHEELELAWRGAPAEDRDFYQGLVHVAVAWYQATRGNRVGATRQLDKALRRLGPYEPAHRGVDVARTRRSLRAAYAVVVDGSLDLPPPRV